MTAQKSANEYQVGGSHYHNENGYPHWDLCITLPLSYLEGQTTKYVVRHKEKGGVEDLKKALHYLNKLEEDGSLLPRSLTHAEILTEVCRFSEANGLNEFERGYVQLLSTWTKKEELIGARFILFQLLAEAERVEPRAVPLTEENHYSPRQGDPLGR